MYTGVVRQLAKSLLSDLYIILFFGIIITNNDLSSSYQTIYNDSGRYINLYRYGKLRMLFIQDVLATTSVHSLIPASDMPLGGSIRGALVCSHDSLFTIGDLFINSSHTYWLTDTGEI